MIDNDEMATSTSQLNDSMERVLGPKALEAQQLVGAEGHFVAPGTGLAGALPNVSSCILFSTPIPPQQLTIFYPRVSPFQPVLLPPANEKSLVAVLQPVAFAALGLDGQAVAAAGWQGLQDAEAVVPLGPVVVVAPFAGGPVLAFAAGPMDAEALAAVLAPFAALGLVGGQVVAAGPLGPGVDSKPAVVMGLVVVGSLQPEVSAQPVAHAGLADSAEAADVAPGEP